MVYYKLILDKRRLKADGHYSVVVRVIFNKTNTTISTGVRIDEKYWNGNTQQVKNLHPNSQILNHTISTVYLKVQKAIHKLRDTNEFSFEALKAELSDKPRVVPVTFYSFSEKIIREMIEVRRTGNAIVYQTAVNRLVDFCNNKNLKFSEIDYAFLEAFKHKLTLDGVKKNTISNYFRSIRAIYNKAIKAKITDRALYPFHDISVKQEKTSKRAISADHIKSLCLKKFETDTPSFDALNYFLLSFFMIGASFTDLAYLKYTDIKSGRVIFRRRKTHKVYNVKLTQKAASILSHYAKTNVYLLPVLPDNIIEDSFQAKKIISQWIKTTNKYLKRLGEDLDIPALTTYVARHTWATTAKRMGYSNELIAEAMGHEYGNRTTAIYLDSFDQEVIDDMNEKVCKSIFKIKFITKNVF